MAKKNTLIYGLVMMAVHKTAHYCHWMVWILVIQKLIFTDIQIIPYFMQIKIFTIPVMGDDAMEEETYNGKIRLIRNSYRR